MTLCPNTMVIPSILEYFESVVKSWLHIRNEEHRGGLHSMDLALLAAPKSRTNDNIRMSHFGTYQPQSLSILWLCVELPVMKLSLFVPLFLIMCRATRMFSPPKSDLTLESAILNFSLPVGQKVLS